MKILMTGASGFIGKKVLECLDRTQDVTALSSQNIEGINCIQSLNYNFDDEYLSNNGCEQIEVLLHIGAFIPKSSQDADNPILTTENILNTQKLLSANLPNLKKIIYISSLDVYQHCEGILSENTPTIPSTMYGWSKLYCEQLIMKHCQTKGIDCVILRLGHVYGEGEEKYRKVMPIMVKNAISGENINIYGDGEAIRSFIYIDDVVQAIVNSLKLEGFNVINIVGDETTTINELVGLIKSFSDHDISIFYTESNQPNVNYVFDSSKLRRYLLPELTPLKVGLKNEYEYMKRKIQS